MIDIESIIRNLVHTILNDKQDYLRCMYNKRVYGKKYNDFLESIKDDNRAEVREVYNRLSDLGKEALIDMKRITLPYSFVEKYTDETGIKVYRDDDGYCYVIHKGKKLYGQKAWNEGVLARYYNGLLAEQDKDSAHSYFCGKDYNIDGEIIADIGAAEGIFGLEVVEQAKKLYLFECSKNWIEPLKKTFDPWKDKVEIVPKYVSNVTNDNMISVDDFFGDKIRLDFVKADIEGAEMSMINGGIRTFSTLKHALICLYHHYEDENRIVSELKELGFDTYVNSNYLVFFEGNNPREYLRHGVVHAINNGRR